MLGEDDPFEFHLAETLGRTVAELRASVSNAEYIQWVAYRKWQKAHADLKK